MSHMPGAIIFVNDHTNTATVSALYTTTGIQPNELVQDTPNPSAIDNLSRQLEINETISLTEFNARVKADPNYPKIVHLNRLRILVVLPSFHDCVNHHLADIVLFVKAGVVSVEKNCFDHFGPPRQSWDAQRINIFNLIHSIKGSNTACVPFPCFLPPPQEQTRENPKPHFHLCPHRPEGMGTLELFGVEALEENGMDEGVFGDKLHRKQHYPIGAAQKIENREERERCEECEGSDGDDVDIAFGDDDEFHHHRDGYCHNEFFVPASDLIDTQHNDNHHGPDHCPDDCHDQDHDHSGRRH